ncbi:putative tRNA-splicing endonuclease subunit tsp-4 [Wickerhamiella sorbophila]|uniref:tRNA-splicing endonuclease subunit SEN34 n=1 Tax=Wickerhamiella sorbophila TaxID=45607 RepID=A0A2T0FPA1_9ASCO|nr:putative tRNA-splicing endonuclease subunit tsp-4 [Wickerhamiella sorbophila]PRT56816.1 putative tRNA-splicing endonuclease subunit tsp-4 [Wickerhamiella sorbophila]
MIDIAIIDGRGLVFDVKQIEELRSKHHICGILTGVLPQFPQQNVFMGLPLQLMPEDVWYLVDQDLARLVDSKRAHEEFYKDKEPEEEASSGMVRIASATKHGLSPHSHARMPNPEAYLMYKYLMAQGLYIMPGLRFGCQYMVYPGDPLRYHAHYNALGKSWREPFPVLDIVRSGRLATSVKKNWVIGAESPDGEYRVFSIEWAAFG